MISGVDVSDSFLTRNMPWLIPASFFLNAHHTFNPSSPAPATTHPATLSLFSIFKNLLFCPPSCSYIIFASLPLRSSVLYLKVLI